MPVDPNAIGEERAFVDALSEKLEKEASGEAADTSADGDGEEEVEVEEEKPEGESEEAEPEGEEEEADDDDDEGDEKPEGEEESEEEPEGEEEPTAEEAKAAKASADDEKKVRAETQALLQRHGLKATVEDVQPALQSALEKAGLKGQPLKAAIAAAHTVATQIIERKLGGMDRAFTRSMMELREYRKQERDFLAERSFFEKNPARALADRIRKVEKPDERAQLIESVQSFIDTFEDKDKSKLFDIETKQEMQDAREEIDRQYAEIEKRGQTADRITQYAYSAARRLGLPWENVENAVVVALNAKPDDAHDLSDAELDQIIEGQLRIERRHRSAVIREDAKSRIRERTKDRRTTTPAARIGGSTAPVGRQTTKTPANDAEFTEHMLKKLGGSR